MYNNRKDVDAHVRKAFAKIHTEKERKLRSLTIARLYYKIHEYACAEQYLSSYLSVKEDNDQAHKMLGHCYKHLKKTEKALESFQNSLILNPKQQDLLIEVCRLLLNNDELSSKSNKALYWCELAEKEKVQDDAVFSLRLKLLNKENINGAQLEQVIQKEIIARPKDVMLRVRLVRYYLEQNDILKAFNYVEQLEFNRKEEFLNNSDWYNVMWLVLSKYEYMAITQKDWKFWLLVVICLERQLQISFTQYQQPNQFYRIINHNTSHLSTGSAGGGVGGAGVIEIANYLFTLDQYLFKVSQIADSLNVQKDLMQAFLNHYKGQLLLHAVGLVFWRESFHTKNKWKDITRIMLPLLLLAYQSEVPNNTDPWIKHCDEEAKRLVVWWQREGSFRAIQAGRTLLSCLPDESNDNDYNVVPLPFGVVKGKSKKKTYLWGNQEELLDEVRQICADSQWRQNIFGLLFNNSDQKLKESSSYFIKCNLKAPRFEMPRYIELETYEEAAQYLSPSSLKHMTYIGVTTENLANLRAKYFCGLNFSTQNLAFCGAESLNQLDIDSFLYACAIQSRRALEIERKMDYCQYMDGNDDSMKPLILPFVNLASYLCTEEQCEWWHAAHTVYKNLSEGNDLATLRATIQYGIEAVRGLNGPKIDMTIVFKLGQIFVARSQNIEKPLQKSMLEVRANSLFKYGLYMLKMHNKGILEPFVKYFKYSKGQSSDDERELVTVAENAVSYIALRCMKHSEYEELIEELGGLQLPLAAYMQAEAYRKLNETSKTPRKVKGLYIDRAKECLDHTMALLKDNNVDPNHPLNAVIANEIQRYQQINDSPHTYFSPLNNSSRYEDAETDFYAEALRQTPVRQLSTSRREIATATAFLNTSHNQEMESLMKEIASTLASLKKEIFEIIKPELQTITKEIGKLKDNIIGLQDSVKKIGVSSTNPPSREDGSNILDDYYIIDDALQQQLYQSQQQHTQGQISQTTGNSNVPMPTNNLYSSAMSINGVPPAMIANNHFMGQTAPRMLPPKTIQQMLQNYNTHNSLFPQGSNYPYNFYGLNQPNPYVMPSLNTQGVLAPPSHPLALGARGPIPPYIESNNTSNLNYHLQPTMGGNLVPFNGSPSQVNDIARSGQLYNLLQHTNTASRISDAASTTAITTINNVGITSMFASGTMSLATSFSSVTASNTFVMSEVRPTIAPTSSFNKLISTPQNRNNQQVEKTPPANVVITSSDPLPNPVNMTLNSQQQPALSVNIPAYHIKQSAVGNQFDNITPDSGNIIGPAIMTTKTTPSKSLIKASSLNFNASVPKQLTEIQIPSQQSLGVIGTPQSNLQGTCMGGGVEETVKFGSVISNSSQKNVYTGEEDAKELCCLAANLTRFNGKETIGSIMAVGNIRIIKTKDGSSRVVMRQLQTNVICVNHKITKEMVLTLGKEGKECVWEANEFEEPSSYRLDKFCVSFKTSDMTQKFQTTFVKAQSEIMISMVSENVPTVTTSAFSFMMGKSFVNSTPATKNDKTVSVINEQTKNSSLFFGSEKPVSTPCKVTTASNTKSSPFADFSFGNKAIYNNSAMTLQSSPFSNLFGGLKPPSQENSTIVSSNPTQSSDNIDSMSCNMNKSNVSEPEEYIPTAQFQPVIPLPALVEVNTGEENEVILFEHRAKLLRYDKTSKEWKERGIGKIKLLQHKDDLNNVRLVMRREQVHKLCCNQRVYKRTVFSKFGKNSETAVTWGGQDYSESELVTEMFTIRFKKPENCAQFLQAITTAQNKMTSEANENTIGKLEEKINESNKADKDSEPAKPQKGFGNAFKPKAGSWNCESCYTNNESNTLHCVACEAPKDNTVSEQKTPSLYQSANIFGDKASAAKQTTFSFGLQSAITNTTSGSKDNSGNSSIATNATKTTNSSSGIIGFGDNFKPKPGSWTCEACYVSNNSDILYCQACNSPKDNTVPPKSNVIQSSKPLQKFNFGFNMATTTTAPGTTTALAPITVTVTSSSASKPIDVSFGHLTTVSTSLQKNTDKSKMSFTFSQPFATSTSLSLDGAESQNSNKPYDQNFAFNVNINSEKDTADRQFSLDKKDFSFTLKPKSPGKVTKSPIKFGGGGGDADVVAGEEDGGDGTYADEEENNTYFTPVIPLPEKIIVRTGEEDEDLLYVHRAKLFCNVDKEWKERGVGNLKILRHRVTGVLRVLMRRDQVAKICLNHILNKEDVRYNRKDEKSWIFVALDFSDGEYVKKTCSLRFKNAEIAEDFIKHVNKALDGTAEPIEMNTHSSTTTPSKNDAVDISISQKEQADKLLLPYDFYVEKTSCSGCRGCKSEEFQFPIKITPEVFINKEDCIEETLPLELPSIKPKRCILKKSVVTATTVTTESPFSGSGSANTFSFTAALNECKLGSKLQTSDTTGSEENKIVSQLNNTKSPLEKNANVFGGSVFGGSGSSIFEGKSPLFGTLNTPIFGSSLVNSSNVATPATFGSGTSGSWIFGNSSISSNKQPSISVTENNKEISSGFSGIFGNIGSPSSTSAICPAKSNEGTTNSSTNSVTTAFPDFGQTSVASLSFHTLASGCDQGQFNNSIWSDKSSLKDGMTSNSKPVGGFFGLQHIEDAFAINKTSNTSNISTKENESIENEIKAAGDNDNYDPHYEPVLVKPPDEIAVSTGEEEEEKVFGSRAVLYRYNNTTKEWKERGVGELKLLKHTVNHTYRLVMRREQVYKLVLNHGINADFNFAPFNKNARSFNWRTLNYAESNEGILESLAVRFKKEDVAQQFGTLLKNCIKECESKDEATEDNNSEQEEQNGSA